ncbi:MAG: hypothetical protein U0X93_03935 [Anaerolineales bacterium]
MKVAISSSGFFVMTGTSASSAGKPVTSKRNGFSSDGLFRMARGSLLRVGSFLRVDIRRASTDEILRRAWIL